MKTINYILLLIVVAYFDITGQQINIPRIESMPNLPAPYTMRNWHNVALGYDSLVFNFNLTGQYLPLGNFYSNTINYPHPSFRLETVVGSTVANKNEAINVLPAVISASLNGINKSSQNGNNYVLMCEEFFNRQNGTNLYLNGPSSGTGDDWWYETMPNVFFYQMNYLYPHTGDFDFQFSRVADLWKQAVDTMGASTTPWTMPVMLYRAFNFSTWKGATSGVLEPEAAGAISWILYNAYVKTGNAKYRIAAEQSLEFLNSLTSNPSYELQLGYGVQTAARMNAEIRTNFDIEKMFNWCFNVGPLRDWGSILGNWGGYDVNGMIGEVSSNDYAFIMNTFELAGALAPAIRYDSRFARAFGKWILNAANSARLLYPNYLPQQNQDSYAWASAHDPYSYISHEAMRKTEAGQSPYATGDAISGGWGYTNLMLYSSSHSGIFGAIIDTTNVEKILKINLLKTDYYHNEAYPTFLYFNPYSENKSVTINVGTFPVKIYDAVSKAFISGSVTGNTNITISANSAIVAVLTPAAGLLTSDLNRILVNGVVIDFNSGQAIPNFPPRIKSLSAISDLLAKGDSTAIYCTAVDDHTNPLTYQWSTNIGTILGNGNNISYKSVSDTGTATIKCKVIDGGNLIDSSSIQINIVPIIIRPLKIINIKAFPRKINLGSNSILNIHVSNVNSGHLTYFWTADGGNIAGTDSIVNYTAPSLSGDYNISCKVVDNYNSQDSISFKVEVRNLNNPQTGNIIASYPFNGNAGDVSGNNLNGLVNGAVLVNDRFNHSNSAYYFNGIENSITINNNPILNFQNAITVNFWIKVGDFFNRESYPISHGNWESRWKTSIANNKIRWTIKTTSSVKDLDSESNIYKDSLYNITLWYDGNEMELYINNYLDSFVPFSGLINQTSYGISIGQSLPNNTQYGFKGVLDDIKIYNYGLALDEINSLYDITSVKDNYPVIPSETQLFQNYPNPFNPVTTIRFNLSSTSNVTLIIYDILGREIETVLNKLLKPGEYSINFNGKYLSSGVYIYQLKYGQTSIRKKMMFLK